MSAFDNFDYGKLAQGAGKAVKGIVKAVNPAAGPGIDEAGSGLGDILKAAGLEVGEGDEAPNAAPPPSNQTSVRAFDQFGFTPKAPPPSRPLPPSEDSAIRSEPGADDDRSQAISALAALGYDGPEIERILAGPPSAEPARRGPEAEARTQAATALTTQQPARRVKGAPARRVKPAP